MAQIILDSNNNLIQGDFDNATLNNRTKLQTTTTNATTNVYVVPNGSSTSAGVSVANNSSLTNASKIVMATNGSTDVQIISGVNGSGTYLPLSFYTNNALAAQISTAGVFSATGGIASSSMPTGSVLQVVTAYSDTQTTTTSTSYVTANLSSSITPSSASNKILILVNTVIQVGSGGDMQATIFRGTVSGTNLASGATSQGLFYSTATAGSTTGYTGATMSYLDSPATTSSTTYTVGFKTSGITAVIQKGQSYATITLMEIKG